MTPDDLRGRLLEVLAAPPRSPLGMPSDARPAAVLIPVVAEGEPSLLLTRRADHLPRHAGEVSFPGGMPEPRDGGVLEATALREFEEELGVPASEVEVLGAMAPVHTVVSGIAMVPYVGWLERRPATRPDPSEVAEVIEPTIVGLAAAHRELRLERAGESWVGPAFDWQGHVVWGATGYVLEGLFHALGILPGERVAAGRR